jgi:hypothetical protein
MFYPAADDPDVVQPWFLRKSAWIIAAIVFCLLAVGVVGVVGVGIFTFVGLRKVPEIGGGLKIEADPNTRIYFGDRLVVGETQPSAVVYSLWPELFGDEKHTPWAVQLPDADTKVTPEMVSGPGTKLLVSQGIGGGGSQIAKVSGDEYWIRRADGSLDHVFAIVIDWAPPDQLPRRFLLPVRVRKGKGASTVYFNASGSGSSTSGPSFVRSYGQAPIEVKMFRKFTAGSPPGQFAEEIKTKGLWEPGSE